jgi:hypothetical protein
VVVGAVEVLLVGWASNGNEQIAAKKYNAAPKVLAV